MEDNREFKVLDDRDHVLLRPNMYLGGVNLVEKEKWIYDQETGRFEFKTVKVVPALLKCASEIIDNAIDVAIDTGFKTGNRISVKMDEKSIRVTDNGTGIPVKPPKGSTDGKTCVELAWTKLRAGTSFGDNRKKSGANGLGSSCVNVFSLKFIGKSDDGVHSQTITCSDNMSKIKAGRIGASSGKSGVDVYLEPDLARFGLEKIDKTHIDLVHQRLVSLAISYPKIKFSFNGRQLNVNEKKFATAFSDDSVVASSENATICVFPNKYDEFRFYTLVNGIEMFRGGTHVDYVTYEITSRVRDKLVKKYKSIRPGDVKNKLGVAVLLTDFENPQFDAQTKESLSNAPGETGRHLGGKIDFDELAKKILKNEAIIDPIVETFKIKEELKARQELKQAKKVKIKSDKYMSPIGGQKYIFLCEGQSAASSLCACLGRDGNGFYSLRGLPINVLENSIQKIAANQEFKDVMNILQLDISKGASDDISFEKIVIACDQDLDGNHLSSVLVGWFRKFAPALFNSGRICKLQTPLVIVKDQKDQIRKYFFDLDSFKTWERSNSDKKLRIFYQKGLGSIERADMNWLMAQNGGMEQFLYELNADENGFAEVDLWLSGDAEPRKEKLRQYSFDIDMV